MQFAPLTMLVNVINAVLIAVIVAPVASPLALVLWLGAILTIAVMGMRAWNKGRRSIRRTASVRAIRRATINASVLTLLWALVPIAWFPIAAQNAGDADRFLAAFAAVGDKGKAHRSG